MPYKYRAWSLDEMCVIASRYPNETAESIAESLGRTARQTYNKANSMGLKKSEEFLKACGHAVKEHGVPTQFKSGNLPWNNGTKGLTGNHENTRATQFKPGMKPHTWNPIGHERITQDGYLERKITDTGVTRNDYRPVHHLIWMAAYGDIPKKHIIIFIDGNKSNIELSNLQCISMAENMRRNTIHRFPEDLKEVIRLNSKVKKIIRKREETCHEE